MNYEEIIEKIEDILEEGKPSFGGGGKIKVDGDAITECLKELSSSIPTEIIQARKIVAERREILQAAQETASKIVSDAQVKAEEMTQEHEITKAAKDAALKILNESQAEANDIVVFDFEGFANGEKIEHGDAKNYTLDLANSGFIPGFAEQLVDRPLGEEFEINVTFPEEYQEGFSGCCGTE